MRNVTIEVNGQPRRAEVEDRWSLADALRDRLGLTGTHLGCEQGVCGACTVLLDGQPVRSCLLLAAQCETAQVTTVEGGESDAFVAAAQRALVEENALQCGFCTPGFVMLLAGLLHAGWSGDDEALKEALSASICRCTGYAGIIRAARKLLREHGGPDVRG
jgi:aerobic carbon-monoxide dehydrogenase small subunit